MCFSPEASFGAAAVISTIGVISYRKAKQPESKFLALVPFVFGLQQFFEGWLWLTLENEALAHWEHHATLGFLIFAWLVWPVYMPYALWKLEKSEPRKKTLLALLLTGCLVAIGCIYTLIWLNPVANIVGHSIKYTFDVTSPYAGVFMFVYLTTTLAPAVISSVPKMWIVGTLNLLSYAFIRITYHEHVVSIWCFFGSIISALILWVIVEYNRESDVKETEREVLIT